MADEKLPKRPVFGPAVLPSEALYMFVAWLTCRNENITAGAGHDSAGWAELVKEFCEANKLPEPRDGVYPDNLIMPFEKSIT